MKMETYRLSWGTHTLELGKRTHIMGVVNVTPDSFSDGGDFFPHDHAVKQGLRLFEAGADILDIGGESTRPFSDHITVDEEIRRVVPVVESLAKTVTIPISVDTTKSAVAQQALAAGASIVNDISALKSDPQMAEVVARHQVPVILMHMKGTPKTMQEEPVYDNVVKEVMGFLENAMEAACHNGVDRDKMIIDPGIGFGKTFEHNLILLKHLHEFQSLKAPLLIGSSRKAFIRNLVKGKTEKDIDPKRPEVEIGSQAAVAVAALMGVHIVRVHNVENTVATLNVIDAIKHMPDSPRKSA